MVFLELRRDSRVTTGISGFLLCKFYCLIGNQDALKIITGLILSFHSSFPFLLITWGNSDHTPDINSNPLLQLLGLALLICESSDVTGVNYKSRERANDKN